MHRKQFSVIISEVLKYLCETFSESYTEKRQVPKSELQYELYRQEKKRQLTLKKGRGKNRKVRYK